MTNDKLKLKYEEESIFAFLYVFLIFYL